MFLIKAQKTIPHSLIDSGHKVFGLIGRNTCAAPVRHFYRQACWNCSNFAMHLSAPIAESLGIGTRAFGTLSVAVGFFRLSTGWCVFQSARSPMITVNAPKSYRHGAQGSTVRLPAKGLRYAGFRDRLCSQAPSAGIEPPDRVRSSTAMRQKTTVCFRAYARAEGCRSWCWISCSFVLPAVFAEPGSVGRTPQTPPCAGAQAKPPVPQQGHDRSRCSPACSLTRAIICARRAKIA